MNEGMPGAPTFSDAPPEVVVRERIVTVAVSEYDEAILKTAASVLSRVSMHAQMDAKTRDQVQDALFKINLAIGVREVPCRLVK